MIWQLIRRDPALKWIPLLTILIAGFTVVWRFAAHPAGEAHDFAAILALVVPLGILIFAGGYAATVQLDEAEFQAALPVTLRDVFAARIVSMLALLWLPVAAGVLVLRLLDSQTLPAIPVRLWLVFTSALISIQCLGMHAVAIPRWLNRTLPFIWMGLASQSILLARLWPWFPATVVTVICGVASIGLLFWTWQSSPESFQLRSVKGHATPAFHSGQTKANRTEKASLSSGIPRLALFRTIFQWGGFGLVVPFLLLLLTANPFFYAYLGFEWIGIRSRISWLTALPISPRILLAFIVMPTLLALGAGYLVGIHGYWPAHRFDRGISIRAQQDPADWPWGRETASCGTMNVLPSIDYWSPARGGSIPVIRAPWGETYQPLPFQRWGIKIFNPYAVGCSNSDRFFEWQLNRATVAVFGQAVAHDKSKRAYIVDSTPTVDGPRKQSIGVGFVIGFSMLTMVLALLDDGHFVRRVVAKRVRTILKAVIFAAVLSYPAIGGFSITSVILWLSWILPASSVATIATLIAVLGLLYLVLDVLFRQTEIAEKPRTPGV